MDGRGLGRRALEGLADPGVEGARYPPATPLINFPPSAHSTTGVSVHKSLSLIVLGLAAGCGGNRAEGPKPVPNPYLNLPMVTPALAGQRVAVLPLTLALPDAQLAADTLLGVRANVLAWSDSMQAEALNGRAPEVTWVGPAELRRDARRAAGLAGDPDHFAHALLRDPLIKTVPDPLRSQIRTLVALTDARYALAPAIETFQRDSAGVKLRPNPPPHGARHRVRG